MTRAPRFFEGKKTWSGGRWRVALAMAALLAFPFFEEGCSTAPRQEGARASGDRIAAAQAAYAAARLEAWAPRRFKALFKAEISPKVGAVGRGYLSVFWNGQTLAWRSSAPLAGAGRGGSLRKGDGSGADGPAEDGSESLFPAKLAASDVLASLLGAPDAEISSSSPFEEKSGLVVLRLQDRERRVGIDRSGHIVLLSFPGGVEVKVQPGEGVPRRIEATGPDGRAVLVLQSFGPWPESEAIPPT